MLRAARAHDSITLEADAKHLLTDVWTTVGIVAGLLVVMWRPEWSILDPLMAIAVAIQIVFTGVDLLRRSADALLDAALPPEELRTAEAAIRGALPPEADFHALRTRKAGSRRFLDLHLVVPGDDERRRVARAVRPGRGGDRRGAGERRRDGARRAAGERGAASLNGPPARSPGPRAPRGGSPT